MIAGTDPNVLIAGLTGEPSGGGNERATHGPAIISAADLMAKTFTDPKWAVPGVFPEGVSLLVGPPKKGKSWMALNVAVAIAAGGFAIGKINVEQGDVLYLALEDTERRLQQRLFTVLGDAPVPDGLDIATAWPVLGQGAAEDLRSWLASHPEARLVIIDTLARVRGPIPTGTSLYQADYAAMSALKAVADEYGVAFVVVHHSRKAAAEDPLDLVSGTAGLAGAADTTVILTREIGRSDATLYVRGRDVPEADHALSFDAVTCAWTLLGDAERYRTSDEQQQIIEAIRSAGVPLAPKEIADKLGKTPGSVRFLLHKMTKAGRVDGLGGTYRLPLSPTNTANTANAEGIKPATIGNSSRGSVSDVDGTANTTANAKAATPRGNLPAVSGVSGVSPPVAANGHACRMCGESSLPGTRDICAPCERQQMVSQ